jgi:3'-phosphoadenosine 5'-phosphosulfate sulfotransferase (PAPS reductase)/FAD synthetase
MADMVANVVSVSGGKDSTALLLLSLERQAGPIAVFADTGHEHPATYEYVDYLAGAVGVPIRTVRADFTARMEKKRAFIAAKWPEHGVPQARVDRALEVLRPTGNPFLDLCMWKGRFPSTKARFCTEELKVTPINEQVMLPLLKECRAVVSWQGVRREESLARRGLAERDVEFGQWEPEPEGLLTYRPILDWLVADVFAMHDKHGIKPNPLYLQGMGRVGCMPCIMCRKDELREIADRFPGEIERVREWEALVNEASKRGAATFFANPCEENVNATTHGIGRFVDWSRTSRGGRQFDMLKAEPTEAPGCGSIYGLCE